MSLVTHYLSPVAEPVLFSDERWVQAFLRFESELAQAQAECQLIPQDAADAIAHACHAVHIDVPALIVHGRQTGALGMAVVRPLQQYLLEHAPDAVRWLHWGTTTQDVVDTALVLLTAEALQALLAELQALVDALISLAQEHAATPMLARSLLQPAQITSFGLKCAQMALAVQRSVVQLQALAPQALCVQLGGAVGNRASLGVQGDAVEQALARRLNLSVCGFAWHTQRDAMMRLGMEVAVCGGSLAKLAKDWSLMLQYEVAELSEAARGGTSSAMPHKRNPVFCLQALTQTQPMAHIAGMLLSTMAQAHERALGEWQAEVAQWGALWTHGHAAAQALRLSTAGMTVHSQRMSAHIDALYGCVFSEGCVQVLASSMDLPAAKAVVEQLAAQALQGRQPLAALLEDWLAQQYGAVVAAELAPLLAQACDVQRATEPSRQTCAALLRRLTAA